MGHDREVFLNDAIDICINAKGLMNKCKTNSKVDAFCFLRVLCTIVLLLNVSLSVHAFQHPTPVFSKRNFDNGPTHHHKTARLLSSHTNGRKSPRPNWAENERISNSASTPSANPPHRRFSTKGDTPIPMTQPRQNHRSSLLQLSMKDGSPTETIALDPSTESAIYSRAVKKTILCVAAATAFGLGILYKFGFDMGAEFFAGYLVEQSLSIDNLFVFLLLFDYFNVPLRNQDRVLTYGIYGSVVMRAVMIGLGSVALQRYQAILLVFAGILVYSSVTSLNGYISAEEEEEEDMGENAIVKFSKKLFATTEEFDGNKFFTIEEGIRKATPLFICLVAVEISDVVFAVDSIPAVFGVTENPLVVFTSNMFAIIGLRSLYTILSKAAKDLEFLEPAVAVVLGFIGSKMVAEYFGFAIPTEYALGVVAAFLSFGVFASVWKRNLDAEAVGVLDAEAVVDSSSDINS